MKLNPLPLALGVLLLGGAARAQHAPSLVEPTNQTAYVPGVGAVPLTMAWKLGCVGDESAVDQATFLEAVQVSKDLLATNAHNGSLVPLPQSGSSALTGFDLAFTLSGTPPPLTAAVAELETYFEARLGSQHAAGAIPITIQWGPLPAGVLMSTGQLWGTLPYTTVRANLVQWMDPTDVLPAFLPAGPTYPVRFDGTTTTVTDVANVQCSVPWLQGTFPNVGLPAGPYATITISSAYAWDFDPTNGIGAGFCLKSALAHEIVHALGFASDVDLALGVPTQLDLLRFQNSANRPGQYDYLGFGTIARLVDSNTPDNDVQVNLGTFSYRMEDGAPYQGSHFLQTTPPIGAMQPALASGQTFWPDYLRTPDLRVLDVLGYDWVDPAFDGIAHITSMTKMDEDPNSSQSVRFLATFDRRVAGVGTGDFTVSAFMGTGITSVVPTSGKSLFFDGQNWVDLQNYEPITSTGTDKFAIDLWIKPNVQQVSGAPKRQIFCAGAGGAAAGDSVWLYLDSNNRLRFDTTGDSFAPLLPVINDGAWHHITVNSCCGTNATVQVIVDFTTSVTDTMSINLQPGSAYIGRALSNSPVLECFFGVIDEFRFYNTTNNPSAGAAVTPLGQYQNSLLIACLPFDEVTGNTTPFEDWAGGTAVLGSVFPGQLPLLFNGLVDSAKQYVVTVAATSNSGLLFGEFVDDNSVRDMRSGAPLAGPDVGTNYSFDAYTMQHGAGFAYCEGAICPCSNNPIVGTWVGCVSSIGTGGRLRASGSQSITAGTLTLQGSQMPNSNALYLAGTANANTVLGDGLFCIGGTIVRLGTKLNAAGASQFPDVGQTPIATRVGATAGMTSYFTIWYRNSAAYCTPATFNDSNGWRVTWTP
ncbi:MAG: NF038122 family metalloprotease [Planctomycetes bacterium]|nr:NF038122 family metalloprotease [Planctomycetota bacterium]